MANDVPTRKLAAILHADVVGYSRLMGEDEVTTHLALRRHLKSIAQLIDDHQGRVVNYAGDAVLADFATVTDALTAAVAIQEHLNHHHQEFATADAPKIQFRIGVHLGEVIVDGDDIYGDGVNVAARLETLAEPDGICISEAVRSAVGTKLPLRYDFMGERNVKNIDEPIRAYRVVAGAQSTEGPPSCPYPGMVPFAAANARFFYGRTEEIARMVQLLRRQRFMMVIGPSGSGKSSLVYAGLLPELARSRYFRQNYWLIRTMRPGPHPTDTLADAIGADRTSGEFEPDTIDTLLAANPPAHRLLLLVDQFEEVFAQAPRAEQARFIAALQALRLPDNCALILTLRADFYPDLMTSFLWPVDASQRVEVAPLRGEALREAIVRPAADVGVRIEDSLVNQLVADAADEPGALPLLQETMGLLWDDIEQHTLNYAAYQRLSGAAGHVDGTPNGLAVAIAMKADATLAELNPEQQAIARRIFLRLIQFGEGRADTRRQQPVTSLHAASDTPEAFEQALEHLTDNRLLTRSGGDEQNPPAVDISHESLITGWSRLHDWADERREAEQVRRRLEAKAAEWVRLGGATGGLLDEAELPEAERWLASPDAEDLGFNATLPELVEASQQAILAAEQARQAAHRQELAQAESLATEQRQRLEEQAIAASRMRRSLAGLAAVFVVAVAAALFAWYQEQKAAHLAEQEASARELAEFRRVEAEQERMASVAQLLLIQSEEQLAIDQDEQAALLARQAYLFNPQGGPRLNEQVDRTLRSVIAKPRFSPVFSDLLNSQSVTVTADGTTMFTTHLEDGELRMWRLDHPGLKPTILPGAPGDKVGGVPVGRIYATAISPNGKLLIAANEDGSMAQWDLTQLGAPAVPLPRHPAGVWTIAFSSDGRWLAVGSKEDDSFTLLDLTNHNAEPILVANPDGSNRGPGIGVLGGVAVAFQPDSGILAAANLDGKIRLWDPADLTAPVANVAHDGSPLWALGFSPDGKILAGGHKNGSIRLWDAADLEQPPAVLTGQTNEIISLAFSPDSELLASAAPSGGGIWVWPVRDPTKQPVAITGSLNDVAFTPDGRSLIGAGQSNTKLRMWDLTPSGQPVVLTDHEGPVLSIMFSADGTRLVSSDAAAKPAIRVWDAVDLTKDPTVLLGHENYISAARFSPDGRLLASASTDHTVRVWPVDQPEAEPIVLPLPGLDPWFANFSPDGQTLVAGSIEGVHVWRRNDLTAKATLLDIGTNWTTDVVFSPDGSKLATGNLDSGIYLQDLTRPDATPTKLGGHEGRVWTVAFSPDGNTLASGGRDTTVRLWDVSGPTPTPTTIGRHNDDVWGLAFSPDGTRLATGSKDGDIRLWNVEEPGETPAVLRGHAAGVWSLSFSPDGNALASAGEDSEIRIWDLTKPLSASTTQELADDVCQKVRRNLEIDEWQKFVGTNIRYERTCPNLPVHPSILETAEKLAQQNDISGAVTLIERAVELDPDLDLDPQEEAQRLASQAKQ